MKIDFKGLKFHSWLYLMIFCVLILVVLWALQFLFLNSFYRSMKLNEIKSVGDKVVDEYGSTDFHKLMRDYAFNGNLRIVLFDSNGMVAGAYDGFDVASPSLKPTIGAFPIDILQIIKDKINESGSDRASFINYGDREDMTQAIYAARIEGAYGTTAYLYISSPLPATDLTVSVLRTQFIIITGVLFVMALIVAQVISRKMSKPIVQLNKSAERLAKGDLDVDFKGGEFSETRQLAATLSYATNELKSLDNYRKEFIANVSHDLRTPLTIIKFYGEMVKEVSGDDPAKRGEHCDVIVREVDWMAGMVNEILELSKLESGNAATTKTQVSLSQCLEETLVSFSILTEKEGYRFETDIDENIMVMGNDQLLKRVLYNLISNAVNYTGEDKRVIVSLKELEGKARFEVTDTGAGIPEDKLNCIWDRYYKLNEQHKRAVVGTGLGLSIVKSALVALDADYGVISSEGNGSTFWFELALTDRQA